MTKAITFNVNGQSRTVTTGPDRSLLDVLREDLQLTGAKYGCGEGQCRACTVLLNGKAVAACLTSISDAEKQNVLTIEGLSFGSSLHPVQQAFLDEGAFQCGYCTAGMIMGVVGVLKQNSNAGETDVLAAMNKHICRCCSYPRIEKAARRALAGSKK